MIDGGKKIVCKRGDHRGENVVFLKFDFNTDFNSAFKKIEIS